MRRLLTLAMLLPGLAQAADIYAINSGLWSSTLTWSTGTIPGAADTAINTNASLIVTGAPNGTVRNIFWNAGTLGGNLAGSSATSTDTLSVSNATLITYSDRSFTFSNLLYNSGSVFSNASLVFNGGSYDVSGLLPLLRGTAGSQANSWWLNGATLTISGVQYTNANLYLGPYNTVGRTNTLTITNSTISIAAIKFRSTIDEASVSALNMQDASVLLSLSGDGQLTWRGRVVANNTSLTSTTEGRGWSLRGCRLYLTNATLLARTFAGYGNNLGSTTGSVSNSRFAINGGSLTANDTVGYTLILTNVASQAVTLITNLNADGLVNAGTLNGSNFTLTTGELLLQSGTFNAQNSTITIGSTFLQSGFGTLNAQTSTVVFSSSTNASSNVTNFYNLVVDSPRWSMATNYATPTNVVDASGNGNTATVNGRVGSVDGRTSRALLFDGSSQWLDCGTTPFNLVSNFTICGWVKPEASGSQASPYLAGKEGSGAYALLFNSGTFPTVMVGSTFINGSTYKYVFGVTPVQPGVWTHCAMVVSFANNHLYYNGMLDNPGATFTGSNSVTTSAQPFSIGGRPGTGNQRLRGAISDVRFYNRSLTSNEVAVVYNGNAPTNGLVGYWPMNDFTVEDTVTIANSLAFSNATPTSYRGIANARLRLPRHTLLQYGSLSNVAVLGSNSLTVYGSSQVVTGRVKMLPNRVSQ